MSRLAWSQLRFRPGRALALLAGMLVAATAFTVLTAAARTAQIRTIGTVNAHFQPAYDILVRPAGARSSLESATGTVQPDFLSGIYGGITMAQWHQIQQIAGVQVAAPIAMVGYAFMDADFPVWLPAADVAGTGRQLYRVNTTWVSANGATKIPEPASYVYVTPDRLHFSFNNGATFETLPGGSTVTPCPASGSAANPFSFAARAGTWCWSKVDGDGTPPGTISYPDLQGRAGFGVALAVPDADRRGRPGGRGEAGRPESRADLGPVPSGKLRQRARQHRFRKGDAFPVLATADSGIGESSVTQVQELAAPSAPPVLDTATMRRDSTAAGRTVLSTTMTAAQAYQYLLGALAPGPRRACSTRYPRTGASAR